MSDEQNLVDVFGLCCPACGQTDELRIMITTLARLTADGSEPEGDHEWEDTSYCDCPECGPARIETAVSQRSIAFSQPAKKETNHDCRACADINETHQNSNPQW